MFMAVWLCYAARPPFFQSFLYPFSKEVRLLMKNDFITGKTKCFAIIGDPVEQTLSPIIQNGGMNAAGEDALMVGLYVRKENLKEAIDGVRALHLAGLSVTMPLKTAIIPYLDECAENIRYIGAVNVVTNHDGYLKGYNTDGEGFVLSMKDSGADPKGKSMLMFGAGGAAKGIAYAFLESGISSLTVCNRSKEHALEMLSLLREKFDTPMEAVSADEETFASVCTSADIVMNATNMGMGGAPSPHIKWIPWETLKPDIWICDVVNKPVETDYIKKAQQCGFRTFTGDAMTLYQARIAYHLFFETDKVPFDGMREALERKMVVNE